MGHYGYASKMRRKSERRMAIYKAEMTRLMQQGVPHEKAQELARAHVKAKFTK